MSNWEESAWVRYVDYLPEHMRESARWWFEKGEPDPGHMGTFFRAVLTNDLVGAFTAADMQNRAAMQTWAAILSAAPLGSWGSEEQLLEWHAAHHPEKETAR